MVCPNQVLPICFHINKQKFKQKQIISISKQQEKANSIKTKLTRKNKQGDYINQLTL